MDIKEKRWHVHRETEHVFLLRGGVRSEKRQQWRGQRAPPPFHFSSTSIRLRKGHTSHVRWGHRNDRGHVGTETRMEERGEKQWEEEWVMLLSEASVSQGLEQML